MHLYFLSSGYKRATLRLYFLAFWIHLQTQFAGQASLAKVLIGEVLSFLPRQLSLYSLLSSGLLSSAASFLQLLNQIILPPFFL